MPFFVIGGRCVSNRDGLETKMKWHSGDMNAVALATLLSIVAAVCIWIRTRRSSNYPPGPAPWPLLGNLGFNKGLCMKRVTRFQRLVGEVMTFYAGRRPVVMLGSHEAIVEAFVGHTDVMSSRPAGLGRLVASSPDNGILYSPYPAWKELRRFVLQALNKLDRGDRGIEARVRDEMEHLIVQVDNTRSEAFDMEKDLQCAAANVIAAILFGSRYEYTSAEFRWLMETSRWRLLALPVVQLVEALPVLKRLPFDLLGYHNYRQRTTIQLQYFRDLVRSHRAEQYTSKESCIVDEYWRMQSSWTNVTNPFTEDNCVAVVTQLLTAGTETTANALRWAFLYMIIHPHHQQRVQQEIDRYIGDRLPTEKDEAAMPFTQAVLAEVLRLGCVAPMSPMHLASADVMVRDQLIPKGAAVVANIMSAHLREDVFKDSSRFCPERFMDCNGHFMRPQMTIPFGAGRRSCIGERLARLELFLFFVGVLQRFSLRSPQAHTPTTEGRFRLAHGPAEFLVRAFPRQSGDDARNFSANDPSWTAF